MKKENHILKKYLFWFVLALLLFLSYLMLKPYIIALISAFILAYLIKPFFTILEKRMSKYLAAIICILVILIALIVSFTLIFNNIIHQAYTALSLPQLKTFLSDLSSKPLIQRLNIDLNTPTENLITFVLSLLYSAIGYLPSLALSIAITLLGTYFILTNWTVLHLKLKEFIPIQKRKETLKEISKTTDGIIYGNILVALIEFTIAAIGFYLAGVKLFLLLAILVFFLSFIPFIGPAFVWIPLLIYHIALKNYDIAIGVAIVGVILSILIDSLLKIKITGDKAKINPMIILLGVIGGVPLFGIFGFIIGPLVLSYTIKLLQELLE